MRISDWRSDVCSSDLMPVLGIDAGVLAGLQVLNAANPTDDPNHGAKTVVLFKEPGERGMSLTYVWFKSDYLLPRHSHDTDCLYYVMAGELLIGKQVLRKGDGMFIPAGAGYAYQAGAKGVADRQSVVEGKGGSVSVDLGGRRIIKKKK